MAEQAQSPPSEELETDSDFDGAFVYVDYLTARHYLVLATGDEIAAVASNIVEADPIAEKLESDDALSFRANGAARSAPDQHQLQAKPDTTNGWSMGVDTRVQQTPTSSYPFKTVGFQDPGAYCSGTLVGTKWVLTAAHCIVGQYGQGGHQRYYWEPDWNWHSGRDAGTYHYLSEPIQGGFIPIQWTQAAGSIEWHISYDYGLLALNDAPTPIGAQPPASWMQKTAASDAQLSNWTLRNVGYPRCNVSGSPQGCVPLTQWRDNERCFVDPFPGNAVDELDAGGNMVDTIVATSCDVNQGHSGGPIYAMNSEGGANIVGVAVYEVCSGATCASHPDGDYPNLFRRITQPMHNQLNFWAGFFGP